MSLLFGWPAMAGRFGAFGHLELGIVSSSIGHLLRGETVDWGASMLPQLSRSGWDGVGVLFVCPRGFRKCSRSMSMLSGLGLTSLATGHSVVPIKPDTHRAIAATVWHPRRLRLAM